MNYFKSIPFIKQILIPFYYQIRNFKILAFDYGQKKSIFKRKSIDARGAPIPWYTYPAIEYLKNFDFKDKSVFEFGCGFSSLYWAQRAQQVISVESDQSWFEKIDLLKKSNQFIIHAAEKDQYIESLQKQNRKFDIIIIDGVFRRQCAQEAIKYLEPNGMMILDNTDWYPKTAQFLRENGYFQIDFSGFGPINHYCWTTSLFVKVGSTLQRKYLNPQPIGGIKEESNEDDLSF